MLILGVILAILANIVYPLSFAMIRKVEDKIHPVFICTIRIISACCVFLLIGLISGFFTLIWQISAKIWGILFVSLLGLDIFGDIAYFYAQKRLGTTKAITVAMSYPLFTMLFAFPLLHQPLKWFLILSAVVIGIGIYFLTARSTRESASPPLPQEERPTLQQKPSPHIHLSAMTQGFLLAFLTAILWALGTISTEYGLVQVENTPNG